MRKRITFMVLTLATLFLFMPMAKGKPFPAVRYYTVHCSCGCVVSPQIDPIGEWTRYCDDTYEGWGNRPGDPCTSYDVTIGEWCDF